MVPSSPLAQRSLASPIPTQTQAEKGMLRLQSYGHFAAHAQRTLSLRKPINHFLSSAAAPKNQTGKGPAALEPKTGNGLGYFCLFPESRTEACGQQAQGNMFLFHVTHNQIRDALEHPLLAETAGRSVCNGVDAGCRRCMHGTESVALCYSLQQQGQFFKPNRSRT